MTGELRASQSRVSETDDIAIVGMSCLFPGADTPARFWQNIVGKVDCISDAPTDWRPDLHYAPHDPEFDRAYTARGGFLKDLCRFSPTKFGVMPTSIEGAEPDHFIALRCAYEALADAGVPDVPLNRERTGIIIGRGLFTNRGWVSVFQQLLAVEQVLGVLRRLNPQLDDEQIAQIKAELKKNLPPANAETFPGLVHSALVGRIANRMDLHGPAYTIDAACSAALLAVDQGIHELRSRRCDAVLVGGAQVSTPPQIQILFCKIQALSKSGQIAPFSAEANGTLLGQGCGLLVLKRLEDAQRDGNRIYALIKAVGSSSDGKGAGLLAPRTEGQQLAIRRAYEQSGVCPSTVELIEAHGTGIPLGDATEVNSIRECFGSDDTDSRVAFGTVKSMIGHLIPAAGAAGIIKTALAMYHRVLPPSLHCEQAAADLELDRGRFFVATDPLPWLHGDRSVPRRAGVNAFGFGGINTHALLEEYTGNDESALPRLERDWPAELIVVAGADREKLLARAERLSDWLAKAEGVSLLDVAASLAREPGKSRLTIVAHSIDDLRKKLAHAGRLLADPQRTRIQDRKGIFWYAEPLAANGKLALVFPGEGSQYVGMHAELCRHFPEVRQQLELTDMALRRRGDRQGLADLLYPRPQAEPQAEDALFQMEVALAAVTASARGLLQLLKRLQVPADAVVGHSSGEFAAVLAAGAFVPADDEQLIQSIIDGTDSAHRIAQSDLVPEAVLTSVGGAEPTAVEQALRESGGRLVVAMDNCPHQVILVGDEATTDKALATLEGKGGVCQRIPWTRPYHTEAVAPVCQYVASYMATLPIQTPALELWSCSTAAPFPAEPDAIRDMVVQQWRLPVRFRETILAMHDAGVRIFVEVGPRGNLSSFVADTLRDRPHAAIPLDVQRKGDIEQLCTALAMLAAHGVSLDLAPLFERRSPALLDFGSDPPPLPAPDPILRLDLPMLELSDSFVDEFLGATQQEQSQSAAAAKPSLAQGHQSAPQPAPRTTGTVQASSAGANRIPAAASPPPAAQPSSARAQAMTEFQHTMQEFLRTQEACAKQMVQRARSAQPPRPQPTEIAHRNGTIPPARNTTTTLPLDRPHDKQPVAPAADTATSTATSTVTAVATRPQLRFIQHVLEHRAGERLVAECELDIERDVFLKDHTFFGRGFSRREPHLLALPIMPMAMTLELMAQAAQHLVPDRCVVALSDIRASRWLPFESTSRRVRMVAEARDDAEVRVGVYEADREGMDAEIATAIVELASAPVALGTPRIEDRSEFDPPWKPEELYRKILYHGPAFQGIERIERWGPHGVRATVAEPDQTQMFADASQGLPLLPVALTDTVSQLPGVRNTNWDGQGIQGAIVPLAFPNHVERLEFVPNRTAGEPLTAVTTFEQDAGRLRSDVEVFDASGRVVLRYLGKVEEVVDFPLSLYRLNDGPSTVRCSRDITSLFAEVPGIEHCVVTECHLENARLFVHRIWAQVLARMVLSGSERATFANLKLPPLPAVEWLFGRVAAKDAVRLHAQQPWYMAEVTIGNDPHGAPQAKTPDDSPVRLSLAHKPLYAVAAAADPSAVHGLGLDVETLQPLDPGLIEDAFAPDERDLIRQFAATIGLTSEQAYRAGWSAKESLGKALGTGLPGGPRDVLLVEAGDKTFRVQLAGSLQQRFSHLTQPIEVHWRLHGSHVIVLCLLAEPPT